MVFQCVTHNEILLAGDWLCPVSPSRARPFALAEGVFGRSKA